MEFHLATFFHTSTLQTASTFSLHREPLLKSTEAVVTSQNSIRPVFHNTQQLNSYTPISVWEHPLQLR